jgi:TetR/AcrR family transcriptional repressor of mexJK operon
MKQWLDKHPKAKLMARKRAAILDAAHAEFLGKGFGATTMEAIAAAANVSIMTLYRHADDKEDLFREVIGRACEKAADAGLDDAGRLLALPLDEALRIFAISFQARLASTETVALLRAVMAETARFPDLAERTWRGLLGSHVELLFSVLSQREETRRLDAADRKRLAAAFLDRLVGTDMLRVLLGLAGATGAEREKRARVAAGFVLAAIPPYAPGRRTL